MAQKILKVMCLFFLFPGLSVAVILDFDPSFNPPADYEMLADPNSRQVYSNGDMEPYVNIPGWPEQPEIWRILGPWNGSPSNASDGCLVLLFELPDRGGQLIDVDMFTFYYTDRFSGGANMENIDVYGLGSLDANEGVNPSMYYLGTWWPDGPAPIMEGIMTAEDTLTTNKDTWRATDPNSSIRLSYFLNSLYDQGAQPGDWAVLRLNGSQRFDIYMRVDIASANDPFSMGPRICYNLSSSLPPLPPVPEPELGCTNPPKGDVYPDFDSEGNWVGSDCQTRLSDLAAIAAEWMQCSRIPQRLCD